MGYQPTELHTLVDEIKRASANIATGDQRTASRFDEVERSVNELFKRIGRPGSVTERDDDADERKSAGSYWRCPRCDARRCHLYVLDGALACRCCHKLDYRSRHVLKNYPALTRAAKLRRKLSAASGLLSKLPPRPQHNKKAERYDRLVLALAKEEAVLVRMLGGIVSALKRRKGRLHGPR